MNRYVIGSLWDRGNRNGANKNFEYLFEGRQKIDELNSRADNILSETERVNKENVSVQKQVDDLILHAGESDAEVIQARGDAPLLKDRLDKTDSQLAQIANAHHINSKDKNKIHSLLHSGEGLRLGILGDSTEAVTTFGETAHINRSSGQVMFGLSLILNDNNFIQLDRRAGYYQESDYLTTSSSIMTPKHQLIVSQDPNIKYNFTGLNKEYLTIYYLERTAPTAAMFDVVLNGVTHTVDTYATSEHGNISNRIAKVTLPINSTTVDLIINNLRAIDRGGGVSPDGQAIVFGFSVGNGVEINNYAVSSTTLKNNSNDNQLRSITTDERLQKIKDMNANVVMIGWGTNDSKTGVSTPVEFEIELNQRIDELRDFKEDIVIILNTDPRGKHGSVYENNYIYNDIIRKVATQKGVSLIDIESFFIDEYYSDDVHPTAEGHKAISNVYSQAFNIESVLHKNKEFITTISNIGEWTPIVLGSTTEGNNSYTLQEGKYIVNGNIVYIWARIRLSEKDINMAGSLLIGRLPVRSSSQDIRSAISLFNLSNIGFPSQATTQIIGGITPNSNYVNLYALRENNSVASLNLSNITDNSIIELSGFYLID